MMDLGKWVEDTRYLDITPEGYLVLVIIAGCDFQSAFYFGKIIHNEQRDLCVEFDDGLIQPIKKYSHPPRFCLIEKPPKRQQND